MLCRSCFSSDVQGDSVQQIYKAKIDTMMGARMRRLILDINDLREWDAEIADR